MIKVMKETKDMKIRGRGQEAPQRALKALSKKPAVSVKSRLARVRSRSGG